MLMNISAGSGFSSSFTELGDSSGFPDLMLHGQNKKDAKISSMLGHEPCPQQMCGFGTACLKGDYGFNSWGTLLFINEVETVSLEAGSLAVLSQKQTLGKH